MSGRELHEFLEIGSDYTDWMKRMISYGFEENEDFTLLKNKVGKVWVHNHAMTLDMAKEISMLQRNAKGKEARQYFIKNENGQIVVSSRMVAERFGKRHDHVIRTVEEKIAENAILRSHKYYLETAYKVDGNNKSYKEYLMTRDGFTFIVMGFTGKEALQ